MNASLTREELLAAAECLGRRGNPGLAFREETSGAYVTFEERAVESAGLGRETGVNLSLRSLGGERVAVISVPLSGQLLESAQALAANTPLPSPPKRGLSATAPSNDLPPLDKIARLCADLDAAARSVSPRVVQVRVVFRQTIRRIEIGRSDGLYAEDEQRGLYLSVLVSAKKGRLIQTGYEALGGSGGWELLDAFPPEEAARLAANRAVSLLGARKPPGGSMCVVLSSSAGGTMIHEAVGHGLEADLVDEGHSLYRGKIGQKVASELITVVDDPTLEGRRGSYGVDDEGVPAGSTLLVEGGTLKGWLHSLSTAGKAGAPPTGNGRRESYRHRAIPRMSNTLILPGAHDPEKILRETANGLFVTRMGGGQVDTVSGDFVFEVSEGFMIEGGKVGEPVRGATLTGNGPQVLLSIDRVGSDLGFGLGTCGKDGQGVPVSDAQPTLRIPSLIVGGGE